MTVASSVGILIAVQSPSSAEVTFIDLSETNASIPVNLTEISTPIPITPPATGTPVPLIYRALPPTRQEPAMVRPIPSGEIMPSETTIQPASSQRLQLQRGPYFPDLTAFIPASPAPILPEVNYPMRLVIRLSHRRVYVYRGNEVYTSYPVAIGKSGWETPVGTHTITNMQEDPVWRNPFNGGIVPAGSGNPLGDRWIGFWTDGQNAIGFHGTPNEASVGNAASHGCVRMYNRDIRELFTIARVGMSVIVEP